MSSSLKNTTVHQSCQLPFSPVLILSATCAALRAEGNKEAADLASICLQNVTAVEKLTQEYLDQQKERDAECAIYVKYFLEINEEWAATAA